MKRFLPPPPFPRADTHLQELRPSQQGEQWRATLPIWCPYRPGRYWFGAWDLTRRVLLTGMLTLIPVGDEGVREYRRAALALAFAGLAFLVGEVASPYRDPWVGWIYRTVRTLTVLTPLTRQRSGICTAGTIVYVYCSDEVKTKSVQLWIWA